MEEPEMTDARIPQKYFQDRDQQVREALAQVRNRLDQLVERVQELKKQKARTPAHKQLVKKEVAKTHRTIQRQHAMDVMDQIAAGDSAGSVEAIKEALDLKAYLRSEPHLNRVGQQLQYQVFGDSAEMTR